MGAIPHLATSFLRVFAVLWISLRALRRNALRSTLTALGIIIGVASVVTMVAIGNGAQAKIEGQVAALGQNMLMIFAGSRRAGGVHGGLGSARTMSISDAHAIEREVGHIVAVSPEVSTVAQVVGNGKNWSTSVLGQSQHYLQIRDWKLASGMMFSEREVRGAARVAVLGAKTAHELFGPLVPLGQNIRVRGIPFIVIGVLSSKGAGMGGQNQDDRVIIPYTTAMKRLTGEKFIRSINVQVAEASRMEVAQQEIVNLLRQRHGLSEGKEDDFNVFNQKEIADTVGSISRIITLLLGAVSGISLVVGGIGIMNIMLVSVTERTREIGIRIAVGAQPGDIRLQFLIEAITLSLFGGILGIGFGVGAAAAIGTFIAFAPVVSPGSILLAFSVSFGIGVFFGFYPAKKAAAMDPIVALRFE
jgi:putative ABC transport system permease protein